MHDGGGVARQCRKENAVLCSPHPHHLKIHLMASVTANKAARGMQPPSAVRWIRNKPFLAGGCAFTQQWRLDTRDTRALITTPGSLRTNTPDKSPARIPGAPPLAEFWGPPMGSKSPQEPEVSCNYPLVSRIPCLIPAH